MSNLADLDATRGAVDDSHASTGLEEGAIGGGLSLAGAGEDSPACLRAEVVPEVMVTLHGLREAEDVIVVLLDHVNDEREVALQTSSVEVPNA
jgi:hypothetical protein